MIRLDLNQASDWLDLGHGVQLRVAPITTSLMNRAREEPILAELPEAASANARGIALAKALARVAVDDWAGVHDEAGAPAELTPEGLDALLEIVPIFEAFQLRYVAPGLHLEQEKNASAPSQTGTSAGAPGTAATAAKSARPARRGKTRR
ncbi:hypothetical protein [Roseovarius sp. D22-M7]|uniref:hypothetical protein n=1 Tax=Roseovarius sp. D22-M7 TaxID=3127116 RepID=UPI0030106104